ncbi:MAG: MarR family winged helix-turn-helix transcriptional regulator [Granulosicoccus sp.]|nr:MarR family winged helix-turn-helix transcriptional regulator [Granulosicoccus sp.]
MQRLNLLGFIPFRLNRLAAELSTELSSVYADRFGVDIIEWRILATLSSFEPCTAQAIANSTRTHKSRISRGVSRLTDANLIIGRRDDEDARAVTLIRTAKGRALYENMVPLVLEKEQTVMQCLNARERRSFESALSKLEHSLDLEREI